MVGVKVSKLVLGRIGTNCYIVEDKNNKNGIIIDPAADAIDIMNYINQNNINIKGILLTHGHFDHILAADELRQQLGVQIYASEDEKELLSDAYMNCSKTMCHMEYTLVPDVLLKDNEIISIAGIRVKIIHTPGHTAGGVCYYFLDNNILVSGDTLFKDSIGRADLPTSNGDLLIHSINEKLMILDENMIVLPGHGDSTTIGYEKKNNAYL